MHPRIGAFIHSEILEKFRYPAECPFKPERASMTRSLLRSLGLYTSEFSKEIAPRVASERELLLFHDPAYLKTLRRISKGEFKADDLFLGLGSPRTPVFPDLFAFSELAAGGTITAAEMLLHGGMDFAFNPSGGFHVAEPAMAGEFCYINDVVLGCKVLSAKGKKVFCLDLDAHHGGGLQTAFYRSKSVFTVSLHETGKTINPETGSENEIGEGEGFGFNVNIPLPSGINDSLYLEAFNATVPPLIDAYRPDFIVLVLGMNTLADDPTSSFKMTNNAIAEILPDLVQRNIPILLVGGGGLNIQNTIRAWALAWTMLCGFTTETKIHTLNIQGLIELRDRPLDITKLSLASSEDDIRHTIAMIKRTVFPIHNIAF